MSQVIDNATYINANKILMFVTNHGSFARDLSGVFGYDAGTFFPYVDNESILDGSLGNYIVYAAGLWVGGMVDDEVRVIISEYDDEYVPGPMNVQVSPGVWTFDPDNGSDAGYRVYKLYSDSLADNPNQDYLDWPADEGAPVDEYGAPAMMGDQMLWAVYNDADPDQHLNNAGETEPLGLEVRQTTWAYNRSGALGQCIFVRYQVFNKGGNTIEECYLSSWADPDLGEYTDDLVGCDTSLSIGYVYNADNDDANHYGATPPAVGFDYFQGPLIETGDLADTAKAWGELWPGYTNMGMTSFNKYINGTDPNSYNETYNYMRGLDAGGGDYTYNGEVTRFMHAGDPVTGSGDLDSDPADRRWMQTTGPITFEPGDSVEIVLGIVVGRSTNRLTSISLMKNYDVEAQRAYDADFVLDSPPATPVVTAQWKDEGIALSWTDVSETDHGTYPFQGYVVWQGETSDGDWTAIKAYDIQDGVVAIQDEVFDPVTGQQERRLLWPGEDLGVQRYIFIDEDKLLGGDLNNVTQYFFKVSAYSYDASSDPGFLTLNSEKVVSVRPQRPVTDIDFEYIIGDTLPVTHTAGGSNGVITPIVVDHAALNGHTYQVSFEDTLIDIGDGTTADIAWHLDDITSTPVTRLYSYETNQSGDELYPIVDGMLVKVAGPDFGVVAIQEVANATGTISPDNVMYSLNSTREWYITADGGTNWSRLNYRGIIGTYDWEIRFTEDGSEYYDWNTETKYDHNAPFEIWNIGIGTPDDASDDIRVQIAILDDDESGGWSYGDRIYVSEREYYEPLPEAMDYTWPDDFRIGRIVITDYSETTTAPAVGTIIRFTTAKVNTSDDVFQFVATEGQSVRNEDVLNNIKTVPNPFYLNGPYDPAVGNYQLKFQNLPTQCTITIYNLAGEFIREIEKNDATTSIASWDLRTENNLPVASGIYIYVVDAPGIGQKIGKTAVFMQEEVLSTY
ncbi:MAG TPA: hypothetical protein PLF13_07175 [candidate division Zixibacteria bacterium]|nr:hypothetical protein [candidate division Zixibacteria bacterium]